MIRTRVISSREKFPGRVVSSASKPKAAILVAYNLMICLSKASPFIIHSSSSSSSIISIYTYTPENQQLAPEKWWLEYYCWWLKSCTTWDVWNTINNGINNLSTGAGFLPSTVVSFWTVGTAGGVSIHPSLHPNFKVTEVTDPILVTLQGTSTSAQVLKKSSPKRENKKTREGFSWRMMSFSQKNLPI